MTLADYAILCARWCYRWLFVAHCYSTTVFSCPPRDFPADLLQVLPNHIIINIGINVDQADRAISNVWPAQVRTFPV